MEDPNGPRGPGRGCVLGYLRYSVRGSCISRVSMKQRNLSGRTDDCFTLSYTRSTGFVAFQIESKICSRSVVGDFSLDRLSLRLVSLRLYPRARNHARIYRCAHRYHRDKTRNSKSVLPPVTNQTPSRYITGYLRIIDWYRCSEFLLETQPSFRASSHLRNVGRSVPRSRENC